MNIFAATLIMIGLFSLGTDIHRAAQTIADAIRSNRGEQA
jgi:hypothetical protein